MDGVKIARSVDLAFKSILVTTRLDVSNFDSKDRNDPNYSWWDVRWEYHYLEQAVEQEDVAFQNILSQQLLRRIVEKDEEIPILTLGQDESRWDDPKLDAALRQLLRAQAEQRCPRTSYQTSYDEFLATLRAIRYSLIALEKELQNARSFLHEAGSSSEAQRTKWRTRDKQRTRLVNSIKRCNTRLRDLLDPNGEGPSMFQALPPQKLEKELSIWEFRQHAADLYDLFSKAWSCRCKAKHHFKLLLKHRSSTKAEFNILLLFERIQSPDGSPWTHQQISFEMTDVESQHTSKKVRFEESGPRPPPGPKVPQITNFCAALTGQQQASPLMGCLLEGDKCYRVRPIALGETGSVPSEEKSLTTALKNSTSEEFGMVDRWFLALTLASSVLQLYSTPWLGKEWRGEDIVFFRNGPHKEPFTWEEPYLSLDLQTEPQDAAMHPVTTSSAQADLRTEERLAIILLELCFNQPLEESETYKELEREFRSKSPSLYRVAATMWHGRVQRNTSPEFADAIKWCLGSISSTTRMSKRDWFKAFYKNVVVPLQRCYESLTSSYRKDDVDAEGGESSTNYHSYVSKGGIYIRGSATFMGSQKIGGMQTN